MLKPVRIVEPTFAPVTLFEAKQYLRVDEDNGDDDILITNLIDKVTRELDGYDGLLNVAFCTQTWRFNLATWPSPSARIRLSPIQSITSVKYWDANGVQQTLDSSAYSLLEDDLSPIIQWANSFSYPSVYSRPDAIEVIFVAGYAQASVPSDLKDCVLRRVATAYALRENAVVGDSIATYPDGEHLLTLQHRIM